MLCRVPQRSGYARFVLQTDDISHREEDTIYGNVFSLKSNTAPILCKVCLPIIRSYKEKKKAYIQAKAALMNMTFSSDSEEESNTNK